MYEKWGKQLKNVTWGYRDKFSGIIQKLMDQGYLGNKNSRSFEEFDRLFSKMVKQNYTFDVILDEFLSALDQKMAWILSRPELLASWGDYGLSLLGQEWYYARRFFELWRECDFNTINPESMRFILSTMRLLEYRAEIDIALAFLEGYQELKNKLTRDQLKHFIDEGLAIYRNNPDAASLFFTLDLSSSKKTIERLTTDCKLDDVKERLQRLTRSISGEEFEINNFSVLDSDELLEKGSQIICLCNGLYLPQRVAVYDERRQNIFYYLGVTYIGALAHLFQGFPSVHGYPGYETSGEVLRQAEVEHSPLAENLFFIGDLIRILDNSVRIFPGVGEILKILIECEYDIFPLQEQRENNSIPEQLLYRALYLEYVDDSNNHNTVNGNYHNTYETNNEDINSAKINPDVEKFYQIIKENVSKNAGQNSSFVDVINCLPELKAVYEELFGIPKHIYPVRTLTFYADYRYRAQLSEPPEQQAGIEDEDSSDREADSDSSQDNEEEEKQKTGANDKEQEEKEEEEDERSGKVAGYLYDEWNQEAGDYYVDWCCLREVEPQTMAGNYGNNSEINYGQVEKIKKVFERIKPDIMRKEKNLQHGDDIVTDALIRYSVEKKAGLFPNQKVYSKFYKNVRNIAVTLLIDVSGSTGEEVDEGKVLEVEKEAAFTMAEGLQLLGDKFGIYGFSGCGKDNCRYYVYKDFSEDWGHEQKQDLLQTRPDSSTRIGVAIRHSSKKLNQVDADKKLIILITDGKPQDNDGYSPENLYAQYDVRQACLEARRDGIVVFGLSTENNSLEDLEIMFFEHRYLVIKNINKLPEQLAQYYVRLTV